MQSRTSKPVSHDGSDHELDVVTKFFNGSHFVHDHLCMCFQLQKRNRKRRYITLYKNCYVASTIILHTIAINCGLFREGPGPG